MSKFTNKEVYQAVKVFLLEKGVTCCGYTESGKYLIIYNSLAQLTIDRKKPFTSQLKTFITKWG